MMKEVLSMMKRIVSLTIIIQLLCGGIMTNNAFANTGKTDGNDSMLELYVAEDGSDLNDGTYHNPFKSIERAKEEVRKHNKDMSGDIIVNIEGGTYKLDKTLNFTSADSGRNGYRVIWRGSADNESIISGGREISGWIEEGDGTWSADASEFSEIYELYAGGKKCDMARTENRILPKSFYQTEETPLVNAGVVVDRSVVEGIDEIEDIYLHWSAKWVTYIFKCTGIKHLSETETALFVQQTFFDDVSKGSISEDVPFFIENAKMLLDNPGEFYFSKDEHRVYYMPQDGEKITNFKAYAPVLEKLINIEGDNLNNKVEYISFERLTFTHATWYDPMRYGFKTVQAQEVTLGNYETIFSPANISVSEALNLTFRDNTFTGLGAVGLGLHEGVCNTVIEGNSFYDIKDSAITVGLITQAYINPTEQYYDLAHKGKIIVSSERNNAYSAEKLKDNVVETGWRPATNDTNPYFIVNLQENSQVNEARFFSRGGHVKKIELSNDSDFKSIQKTVTSCTWKDYTTKTDHLNSDYKLSTQTFDISLNKGCKYIKVYVSTDCVINDFMVYDHSRQGIAKEEVCKNNIIANNYITRVGDYYWSSPGISAYYTDGLEILNNHLFDLPYSAIAVGWGWNFTKDSTTARNNKIIGNYIEDVTKECVDGGAIYTIGNQPNSVICNNYIKKQNYLFGAIYLDTNSAGFSIYNNVAEDVNFFWMAVSGTHKVNKVWDNYTSTPSLYSEGILDTHIIPRGMPGEAAKKIMDASGLESQYQGLASNVSSGVHKAFGIQSELNLNIYTSTKNSLLEPATREAENLLYFMEEGNGLGQYKSDVIEDYYRTITEEKKKKNTLANINAVRQSYKTIKDKTAEVLSKRNKVTFDELKKQVADTLDSIKLGNGAGCYKVEDYVKLKNLLNGSGYNYKYDRYWELEQEYLLFLNKKIPEQQEQAVNISKGKASYSSDMTFLNYGANEKGNDGQRNSFWECNYFDGSEKHWYMIDLGGQYYLSNVTLSARADGNNAVERSNFEIQASNDKEFKSYTVLGSCGEETFPVGGDFSIDVEDKKDYRYIRIIQSKEAVYFLVAELSAYGYAKEDLSEKTAINEVEIQNGMLTGCTIKSEEELPDKARVYVVLDDGLEKIYTESVSFEKSIKEQNVEFSKPVDLSAAEKIEIFMWKDLPSIEPISNMFLAEFNKLEPYIKF